MALKALEELRRTVAEINMRGWTDENDVVTVYMSKRERRTLENAADEIEAEIAEQFIELPLDIDGVPVRVGDTVTSLSTAASCLRHVKPRTLEDIIGEFGYLVAESASYPTLGDVRKCADEIRELLRGDA